MVITLEGTRVTQDTCFLGFEKNNKVDTIIVNVDTDDSWSYKLDVSYPGNELYNIINLSRSGNTCSMVVTADMLPFHGRYVMQIRGTKPSGEVYHSSMFTVFVKQSIDPSDVYVPVPSEFLQIEENITEINNNPPKPGDDGYWYTWDVNTHQYIKSDIELPSDSVPPVDESTSGWVLSNDGKNIFWYNFNKEALGLGNVDNTSDIDKPVSKAQGEAIQHVQDNLDELNSDLMDGNKTVAKSTGDANGNDITKTYLGTFEQTFTDEGKNQLKKNIGINPISKTSEMINEAGLDATGKLFSSLAIKNVFKINDGAVLPTEAQNIIKTGNPVIIVIGGYNYYVWLQSFNPNLTYYNFGFNINHRLGKLTYRSLKYDGFEETISVQGPVSLDPYSLPIATSSTLGGVLGTSKTSDMTMEVGIDETGRLYTKPITEVLSVDALPANPDPNVLYLIREEE